MAKFIIKVSQPTIYTYEIEAANADEAQSKYFNRDGNDETVVEIEGEETLEDSKIISCENEDGEFCILS